VLSGLCDQNQLQGFGEIYNPFCVPVGYNCGSFFCKLLADLSAGIQVNAILWFSDSKKKMFGQFVHSFKTINAHVPLIAMLSNSGRVFLSQIKRLDCSAHCALHFMNKGQRHMIDVISAV